MKKMVIPPKETGPYMVDSTSSDPYLGGPMEVLLSADGVKIRWAGEGQWKRIDWYEIAIAAGTVGQYREVLEQLRVDAFEEGLGDGVKTKPDAAAVLDYRKDLEAFRNRGGEMTDPLRAG